MSIAKSVTLVVALALPVSSSRAYGIQESAPAQYDGHGALVSAALVEQVREATAPFRDVRNVPAGYGPVLGCVSGPLTGAMAVNACPGPQGLACAWNPFKPRLSQSRAASRLPAVTSTYPRTYSA